MDEADFDAELERRLALLEAPDSGESVLPDLPRADLWLAVGGTLAMVVLALWWGYPA